MRIPVRKLAMWALAIALVSCGEPTVPLRLDTYTFRYDDGFGDPLLTFHWPQDRMPIRFWSNPADSLGEYVAYAIQQWEAQFLYGEFRGVVVTDSSLADVIIQITPAAPTGSLANLPSYEVSSWCGGGTFPDSISIPDSNGVATAYGPWRSQITWTFLSAKTAADSQAAVRCLARVVTHEIGHALGIVNLNHLGTDSTDIMFTFPRVPGPSERDRATIQRAYHTPSDIIAPVRPQ